jgi:hypothetical protein
MLTGHRLFLFVTFAALTLTGTTMVRSQTGPIEKSQIDYRKLSQEQSAKRSKQLESDMGKLKSAAADLGAKLDRVPTKFDRKQAEAEFRQILLEPDYGKQDQQVEKFRARYADQFAEQAGSAGIDPGGEGGRMASLLGLPADRVVPEAVRNNIRIRTVPPPESEIASTTSTAPLGPIEYRPAFTKNEIDGSRDNATADASTGFLWIHNLSLFAGSSRTTAFIVQDVPINSGINHVRVDALLTNIDFITRANVALAGYASSEVLVNLYVFDGSRLVASRTVSVDRAVAWLWGFSGRTDTVRRLNLSCEFDRARPDEARTYRVLVEFEGWVAGAGIAGAAMDMRGHLRQISVTPRF